PLSLHDALPICALRAEHAGEALARRQRRRQAGRKEEGLRRAEVAVECDPASVAAEVRFANVLYNARQYEDAIKILTDALDLEPGLDTAQVYLCNAYV